MKVYKIIKHSNMFSTKSLTKTIEEAINNAVSEGWEVVSVSFGQNLWHVPTGFITLSKDRDYV